MNVTRKDSVAEPVVLIIEDDVLARTAIASFLRECGHRVIEAHSDADAKKVLDSRTYDVDIAICATARDSATGRFEFAQWVRSEHSNVRVLMAATVEKTAKIAAQICEEGPHLRKPYEPEALVDWIKRLRVK